MDDKKWKIIERIMKFVQIKLIDILKRLQEDDCATSAVPNNFVDNEYDIY